MREDWFGRKALNLHVDEYISCVLVFAVQLDVEDGLRVVRFLFVEHVHLHLVVVTLEESQELILDRGQGCAQF